MSDYRDVEHTFLSGMKKTENTRYRPSTNLLTKFASSRPPTRELPGVKLLLAKSSKNNISLGNQESFEDDSLLSMKENHLPRNKNIVPVIDIGDEYETNFEKFHPKVPVTYRNNTHSPSIIQHKNTSQSNSTQTQLHQTNQSIQTIPPNLKNNDQQFDSIQPALDEFFRILIYDVNCRQRDKVLFFNKYILPLLSRQVQFEIGGVFADVLFPDKRCRSTQTNIYDKINMTCQTDDVKKKDESNQTDSLIHSTQCTQVDKMLFMDEIGVQSVVIDQCHIDTQTETTSSGNIERYQDEGRSDYYVEKEHVVGQDESFIHIISTDDPNSVEERQSVQSNMYDYLDTSTNNTSYTNHLGNNIQSNHTCTENQIKKANNINNESGNQLEINERNELSSNNIQNKSRVKETENVLYTSHLENNIQSNQTYTESNMDTRTDIEKSDKSKNNERNELSSNNIQNKSRVKETENVLYTSHLENNIQSNHTYTDSNKDTRPDFEKSDKSKNTPDTNNEPKSYSNVIRNRHPQLRRPPTSPNDYPSVSIRNIYKTKLSNQYSSVPTTNSSTVIHHVSDGESQEYSIDDLLNSRNSPLYDKNNDCGQEEYLRRKYDSIRMKQVNGPMSRLHHCEFTDLESSCNEASLLVPKVTMGNQRNQVNRINEDVMNEVALTKETPPQHLHHAEKASVAGSRRSRRSNKFTSKKKFSLDMSEPPSQLISDNTNPLNNTDDNTDVKSVKSRVSNAMTNRSRFTSRSRLSRAGRTTKFSLNLD